MVPLRLILYNSLLNLQLKNKVAHHEWEPLHDPHIAALAAVSEKIAVTLGEAVMSINEIVVSNFSVQAREDKI